MPGLGRRKANSVEGTPGLPFPKDFIRPLLSPGLVRAKRLAIVVEAVGAGKDPPKRRVLRPTTNHDASLEWSLSLCAFLAWGRCQLSSHLDDDSRDISWFAIPEGMREYPRRVPLDITNAWECDEV